MSCTLFKEIIFLIFETFLVFKKIKVLKSVAMLLGHWFSILKIKLHGWYTTLFDFISPLEQSSLYPIPVLTQWTAAVSLLKVDYKFFLH